MDSFRTVEPTSPEAVTILRAYYFDVISSFYGREALPDEVTRVMLDEPSDDLTGRGGLFLIVNAGVGCGGLRFIEPGVAELTRIFVAPSGRRRRLGQRIVERLETEARNRGIHTLRLDTRADLVEALALYEKLGYVDVEPFSDARYAERWLAKRL